MTIQNRIVGHEDVAPDQLLAHPLNFRRHPGPQLEALRGSLAEIGWFKTVLVNKRTGHVIDGHARVEEAMRQNLATVPVTYLDLSEEEERLALAIGDPITEMAIRDDVALTALLGDVHATDERLKKMLAEMLGGIEIVPEGLKTDPDAIPETPAEPKTKKGDVYVLGDHRLVCGDSLDPLAWKALLGDTERAACVWTDPPYGVNMEEKNESMARLDGRKNSQVGKGIANDDLSPAQLEVFLRDVFALAIGHTIDGGVWYIAAPGGPLLLPFATTLNELGVWRQTLIWLKDSLVLSRSDYHYRTEVIFYGWKLGAGHRRVEDRAQDNVWECPRPKASPDHPTTKPVALIERAIKNSTIPKDIVVDCFGGSGSTLIACETTQRRGRLIELAPGYCDVIVRRWEEATGKQAVLEPRDA
jgi:DNA modification methylase